MREHVVEALLAGRYRMHRAELAERWAALDRADGPGATARQIATRLGVSISTVEVRRRARRLEASGTDEDEL